jgi:serine/threonine-protein kinase RsbW
MKFIEKIPSELETIPKFRKDLLKKVNNLGLSDEDIFNIDLSLQEALVNAIKHGNKLDKSLLVEVSLEISGKRLVIEVKNQGGGFDPKKIPTPTSQEGLLKTSGRGVFLIKKLMDEVEFFDRGRGIRMIKFLNKENGCECKRRKTE